MASASAAWPSSPPSPALWPVSSLSAPHWRLRGGNQKSVKSCQSLYIHWCYLLYCSPLCTKACIIVKRYCYTTMDIFFKKISLRKSTADPDIKVPFAENSEISKVSASKLEDVRYSFACFAYCEEYVFLKSVFRVRSTSFPPVFFKHKLACNVNCKSNFSFDPMTRISPKYDRSWLSVIYEDSINFQNFDSLLWASRRWFHLAHGNSIPRCRLRVWRPLKFHTKTNIGQ